MTYTELLAKHNLKEGDLSASLKKLVNHYGTIEKFIAKCVAAIAGGKLSDKKKKETEEDLAEAKYNLAEADKVIIRKIEAWLPNREKNAAKGKALAAARHGGKTAPVAANAPQEEIPAAEAAPAAVQVPEQTIDVPAAPETTKKKTSWGLYAGLAISFILAAAGIGYYNSQKRAA